MQPARTAHVFGAAALARLAALCQVPDPAPLERFDDERGRHLLQRAEIMVTGWGCPPVDAAVLRLAPRLRLIAHAAGTVRGIVGPDVFARGVRVTHAAAANAVPVAEYTLAATIAANKRVAVFQALRRAGRQDAVEALGHAPIGNYRRVIGIVGASRIGRLVIGLLRVLEVSVLLYDPVVTAEDAAVLGVEAVALDALMARSDVVSVHAPSLRSTRHMIGAAQLALMQDGATLINTSRAALIDQEALIRELSTGRIDAVLDVTEPEVLPPDSVLLAMPNCIVTPHIAGALGLERERLGAMVVDEIGRFLHGEPLQQEVREADMERIA